MIIRLEGVLLEAGLDWLLVDVGGVGYRVECWLDLVVRYEVGAKIVVWTHEVVRDDKPELFGFFDRVSLEMFWKLIGVSGVGPRVGLKMLGVYSAGDLSRLIMDGDAASLQKVPGVGKKTAQKVVLELRGEVDLDEEVVVASEDMELVDTLVGLGYEVGVARDMVAGLPVGVGGTEEKLKLLLRRRVS